MKKSDVLLCALFAGTLAGAACDKHSASVDSGAESAEVRLNKLIDERFADSTERRKARKFFTELRQGAAAEAYHVQTDRLELVTPAPGGFRPTRRGADIELRLDLESKAGRQVQGLRYKLRMTNSGATPFSYFEPAPSFFKTGSLSSLSIKFMIADSGGKKIRVVPLPKYDGAIGSREVVVAPVSEDERWSSQLKVTLAPGEGLRTRGEGGSEYRSLDAANDLERPGKYKLFVSLYDQETLVATSNQAEFEIRR